MRALRSAMIHGPVRLVVAALLLAVACAPAQPKPSIGTAPGGNAPAASGGEAPAASGAQAGGSSQSGGPSRVSEPLIWFNEATSQNEPLLATSWTNPDPNTWVFILRQGVKFHDGGDFTA